MNKTEEKLVKALQEIKGSSAFVASGEHEFVLPGLKIRGLGELGFPLNEIQIKALIGVAEKAPFGKGLETVTDTNVRSAWQIDAEELTFKSLEWSKFLKNIVKEVKSQLELEGKTIKANLYKLLIYEKGDFFLPHKDSEKEKGMFGTMVVGLPSEHSGGKLLVRFDGKEEVIDFAPASSNYQIPFTAFYADCEHEIKPIKSGYRVCLVYNLSQTGRKNGPKLEKPSEYVDQLQTVLEEWKTAKVELPKVILLDHQYTPANFSLETLKNSDSLRGIAILEAAKKAGFLCNLGLVTCYQMGELEGAGSYDSYYRRKKRWRYYDDEESGDGTMGEIYESYTKIEHWLPGKGPKLGDLKIDNEEVLTNIAIGEGGDPIDKYQEDYTGNAGMTMEYWYHYGAIILWRKESEIFVVLQKSKSERLDYLKKYLKAWNKADAQENAKILALSCLRTEEETTAEKDHLYYHALRKVEDFGAFAGYLAKIKDAVFVEEQCLDTLAYYFLKIKKTDWVALLQAYKNLDCFVAVFKQAAALKRLPTTLHLLEVLQSATSKKTKKITDFVLTVIAEIPEFMEGIELDKIDRRSYYASSRKYSDNQEIAKQIVYLSQFNEKAKWNKAMLTYLTQFTSRAYVNEILYFALTAKKQNKDSKLFKSLYKFCVKDFKKRVKTKPEPLPNWTRTVVKGRGYRDQETWDMLADFLASPTEETFDYRKAERYRSQVEGAIQSATVDLKTRVIKNQGSPYILRIEKTHAAYEKSLKEWNEDVKLLKKLEAV